MKGLTLALLLFMSLLGCKSHSRNDQIDDVCNCYIDAKTYSNTTKQLKRLDECYLKTQEDLYNIQRITVEEDWSDERLIKEKEDFINAITKGKNATQ